MKDEPRLLMAPDEVQLYVPHGHHDPLPGDVLPMIRNGGPRDGALMGYAKVKALTPDGALDITVMVNFTG